MIKQQWSNIYLNYWYIFYQIILYICTNIIIKYIFFTIKKI